MHDESRNVEKINDDRLFLTINVTVVAKIQPETRCAENQELPADNSRQFFRNRPIIFTRLVRVVHCLRTPSRGRRADHWHYGMSTRCDRSQCPIVYLPRNN